MMRIAAVFVLILAMLTPVSGAGAKDAKGDKKAGGDVAADKGKQPEAGKPVAPAYDEKKDYWRKYVDSPVSAIPVVRSLTQLRHLPKDTKEIRCDVADPAVIAELKRFTALERLEFENLPDFSDASLQAAVAFSTLRTLKISNCPRITRNTIPLIARLPELEELILDFAPGDIIYGFEALAGLKKVHTLAIRYGDRNDEGMTRHLMSLSSLVDFSRMPALRHLDLTDSVDVQAPQARGAFKALAKLPLETLKLENSRDSPSEGTESAFVVGEIDGPALPDLFNIVSLRELTLPLGTPSDDSLRGFDKLKNLERLEIALAPYSMTNGLSILTALPKLEHLAIRAQSFGDGQWLRPLASILTLKSFTLTGSDMTAEALGVVGAMKSLEKADLALPHRFGTTADLDPLGGLIYLRELALHGQATGVQDAQFGFLEKLARLKILSIGGYCDGSFLARLTNLKELDALYWCQDHATFNDAVKVLARLPLRDVDISGWGTAPASSAADLTPFGAMKSLAVLTLDNVPAIVDSSIEGLKGSKSLQMLNLVSVGILSDKAYAALAKLPAMACLVVGDSTGSCTDKGLDALAKSKSLRILHLPGSAALSAKSIPAVAKLERLEWIDLSYSTGINNELAMAMAKLKGLQVAEFLDCAVTDAGLAALAAAPALAYLDVSGCPVSAEGLDAFNAARPSTRLVFAKKQETATPDDGKPSGPHDYRQRDPRELR